MADIDLAGNLPEILRIETELKKFGEFSLPLEHFRIPGVYVRVMHIPQDTILTGKIHNDSSIAILAQGRIRIADSERAYIIEAPFIQVDKPGVKRLGLAETDCTFITVHRVDDDATDIEGLEKALVSDTFDDFRLLVQQGRLT